MSYLTTALADQYGRPGLRPELIRALRVLPAAPPPTVWPYIVPYVGAHEAAQDVGLLTAALWAAFHTKYHAPVDGAGSLARALRRAVPYDERVTTYQRLAVADWRTLPSVLRPVITTCSGAGVVPNWDLVHRDLRGLHDPATRRRVLHRWAVDLFHPLGPAHDPSVIPAGGPAPGTVDDPA